MTTDVLSPPSNRRDRLVQELQAKGIADERVLRALREIPRERFVQEALAGKAYEDSSLPIGEKQTISQPWIVGRMCELLEPDGSGKVLEVGSGSGYHAAVLSRIFDRVYTVERIRSLSERARATLRGLGIENVHLKIFDGSYGWSEFAPYRSALVTAVAPDVPLPLVEQLEDGGRLVLPLSGAREGAPQVLTRIIKRGDSFEREEHGAVKFVPLLGRYGWETP
jgi:protein-L-isoaspartate(D-aspartate) O-methyltransferase